VEPPPALAVEFAAYKEVPVDFTPAVEPYEVEPGLANVTNREMFYLLSGGGAVAGGKRLCGGARSPQPGVFHAL
jgi:hypothetical protein